MSDATLIEIDGRPALRFERTYPQPIDRLWQAVSTPAELERWFPAAVEWTPVAGEDIEAFGMTGEVLKVDPPHELVWLFAGDWYGFELAADGAGTHLAFVHAFEDRASSAQTAAGWESYFRRLGPHLEGEQTTEEWSHDGWEADHERYAVAFGVDPAPGRAFIAAQRAGGDLS